MNTIKKVGISILSIVIVAVIYLTGVNSRVEESVIGSVGQTGEYQATSTSWTSTRVIQVAPVTLGSIIITTTDASIVRIMDATSTTDIASTTVAQFQASAGLGTYTFDVALKRGLGIDTVTGFAGKYTATYR